MFHPLIKSKLMTTIFMQYKEDAMELCSMARYLKVALLSKYHVK